MKVRTTLATAVIVGALGISACGGSQTTAAATCLRNLVAADAAGSPNANCGDTTSYDTLQAMNATVPSVSCTHSSGNQYVCDVTEDTPSGAGGLPGEQQAIATGFYSVTFDGHSIVYQPQ